MTDLPSRDWLEAHADDVFDQLAAAMDRTTWTKRRQADDVAVSSGFPTFADGVSRVEGFHIQSELQGVSLDHGLHYFHDACHFAATANRMTSSDQILAVWDGRLDRYRAVVRTGFGLPWPLQDREFLHWVGTQRSVDASGRDVVIIAYSSISGEDLAPAWEGHARCPMAPSGQRLTALGDGRLRAEHCMTYALGGAVPTWAQNGLFHRGHVSAYHEEWVAAMARLRQEATVPACDLARLPS
jgi:hypothetical protein